jgi:glycosyltransferase involved in cell wall biosynthesis
LPQNLQQELELALYLTEEDEHERNLMESGGWNIRLSREVAGNPEAYQTYIQDSRGGISAVKPSCIFFQNAWMSDRSLCYLASGKPVVVQNTVPSTYLPDGKGLLRFSTTEQAITAIEAINRSYQHHCKAAREMAEEYFDSQKVLAKLLNRAI